jgi:hypothetical protein
MERFLKKENQKDLINSIKTLKELKHTALVSKGMNSYLDSLHIGTNPNGGAVSMFITGFPVQIQFPHNESIHMVAQTEHLYDLTRFRGYDTTKYDYTGCWLHVLPMIRLNRYELGLSFPKAKSIEEESNSGEYKVAITSNTKTDENFIMACISLLNWMVDNELSPKRPKERK